MEFPYSQWLTDVGDDPVEDGSFDGMLPVGSYELLVHKKGRPDSGRIPITVSEGSEDTSYLDPRCRAPSPFTYGMILSEPYQQKCPSFQ